MSRAHTIARTARGLAAGVLLANSVPHGVHGLAGQQFPTPFADPPGVGLSSPGANLAWSAMNLAAGTLLARGRATAAPDRALMAAGATAMGFFLVHYFGSLESER